MKVWLAPKKLKASIHTSFDLSDREDVHKDRHYLGTMTILLIHRLNFRFIALMILST